MTRWDDETSEYRFTEDGDIEQRVSCPGCGARWMDVFTLSDQRELEG